MCLLCQLPTGMLREAAGGLQSLQQVVLTKAASHGKLMQYVQYTAHWCAARARQRSLNRSKQAGRCYQVQLQAALPDPTPRRT